MTPTTATMDSADKCPISRQGSCHRSAKLGFKHKKLKRNVVENHRQQQYICLHIY